METTRELTGKEVELNDTEKMDHGTEEKIMILSMVAGKLLAGNRWEANNFFICGELC